IGGGVRLQDKAVIGYLGAPAGSGGGIRSLGGNKPVYDHPNPAYDFWILKLFSLPGLLGRNFAGEVQVEGQNVFGKGNWLQAININPDGSSAAFRIVEPRVWYVDVIFSF